MASLDVLEAQAADISRRQDIWEDRIAQQLDSILRKFDDLRDVVLQLQVALASLSGRAQCPKPGTCLLLEEEVKALRKELEALSHWKYGVAMAATVIVCLATLALTAFKAFSP